ncbi:MAG: hypothetical protein SFU56_04995 [Capsulimonadales bacterium]|nr:hypothetical protein [Capsulimonadales bacterium]
MPQEMSAQRRVDFDILRQTGMIAADELDYWRTHAVPERTCDGARVADLLLRIARFLGSAPDYPAALALLMRRQVIRNDYWKENAVAGKTCQGEYVGNLIGEAAGPVGETDLRRRFPVKPGLIPGPDPTPFAAAPLRSYNYVLGTQTFGAAYQFTRKPLLSETVEAIRDLGASVVKFEISPRYADPRGNVPARRAGIDSLTSLVRDEPTHRQVFDLPFADFVLWAHTFTGGGTAFLNGLRPDDRDREYREMYDLTAHLLRTYSGTGKRFFLGHWEGDGWLRGTVAAENDEKVTPTAVQGMIDWLNTRQKAIEAARRATPHRAVQVWHYTEVNHVKLSMHGRKSLVSEVLPGTNVDFVSYSAYDTAGDPTLLKAALTFIEGKLPRKPSLRGRRVFIGEYGFPTAYHSPAEQERLSRQVMRAGLEWGCPFILYWELYNNDVDAEGRQRGFHLIDENGNRQPVYETHARFLKRAREYVARSARSARAGSPLPSFDAFRRVALTLL